ncbi:MAG: DNA methyltransferase [Chloroflexota bacterium]|nr:DNA methyltransferase [Chloroflexota bacterium]
MELNIKNTAVDFNGPIFRQNGQDVLNRTIVTSDNLPALRSMPDDCVDLIYLDPPFNSDTEYYNPLRSREVEARRLQREMRLPVPSQEEPQQVGFSDVFHMEEFNPDGTPNRNWKPQWVSEISRVIPSLPGIVNAAGAHSRSMQGYVTFMAVRLVEMQRVLKPTGSIYLHCDDTAVHYLRAVMDAVFGPENYLNNIIWRRATSHNDARRFGRIVDHILYYRNGLIHTWNTEAILEAKPEEEIKKAYPMVDEKWGRYRSADLTGPLHNAPRGTPSTEPWHGYDVHAMGRVWSVPLTGTYAEWIEENVIPGYRSIKSIRARLDALESAGMIYHPTRGRWPGLKRYAAADRGIPQQNIFLTPRGFTNYNKKETSYPTEKPVPLLERIIAVSSHEGDIVLDPFCGCATTAVAAENLKRRWIGMDIAVEAYRQVVNRMRGKFPDMASDEGDSVLVELRRIYRVDKLPGQLDDDAPLVVEQEEQKPARLNLSDEQRDYLCGLQNSYCLGCGKQLDLELLEEDHVVPRIQSGPEEIVNIQLLCGYCNRVKGHRRKIWDVWEINEKRGILVNRARMEMLYAKRDAERLSHSQMADTTRMAWWKYPPNGNGK